ncbi:TlpA family protein disulfide reductase [Halobacillus salinarum]|uniref:TlpA family protein disulfide reductase n=1 Tax=Halobacillus salinarum TaxID=2932257 RepID=A0ABY4EFY0_9BACI|nr:TlpA disulfide reductase family protein [Halobacillus salinarum]UOQ42957.1 TlpA family protein disulfide reductase [Halobacillus salinarum]
MVKQWLAAAFLLLLVGLLLFNIYQRTSQTEQNTNEAEGKQQVQTADEQSGVMVAPNAPEGLKPGDKAKDFTLETLDGKQVKLKDLKGKKVFLNFWATWCPPCQEEMPELERFYQTYGNEVEILAVNATGTEKGVDEVRKYMNKHGYHFPVGLDKDLSVNNNYQALTIPTTYFIGTDGKIQEQKHVGPMTFDFMVKMKNKLN